jgi:hypothetical protein
MKNWRSGEQAMPLGSTIEDAQLAVAGGGWDINSPDNWQDGGLRNDAMNNHKTNIAPRSEYFANPAFGKVTAAPGYDENGNKGWYKTVDGAQWDRFDVTNENFHYHVDSRPPDRVG